jgi:decaprenylphospho-beta-D-erythro-pentofuranosid-2-ulose 2-reductase
VKDGLGDVQSVLVLGGTSDIGLAIARRLAAPRGASVVLAGRDKTRLEAAADTLRARPAPAVAGPGADTRPAPAVAGPGVDARPAPAVARQGVGPAPAPALAGPGPGPGSPTVVTVDFDALDTSGHDQVLEEAARLVGDLDVVVVAFGLLGQQEADAAGGEGAVQLALVNYVGAVSVCLAAARRLRAQGHGTLVVLSSVAGERVRKANFIYGSSKAGLDGFAQGLGDALQGSGVGVMIVRPGFVTSKMTTGMAPPPLSTTPEAVADATAKALREGREIIWVPGTLQWVMAATRHLPRPIFRRLPF